MPEVYLATRRDFLLSTQNFDGGWGYFPGKSSWLEPTAYAMLALHGGHESDQALRRAWSLLESWQLADGSWRAGAQVQEGTWVAALAVTLCSVEPEARIFFPDGPMLAEGIRYLVGTEGAERSTTFRLMEFFGLGKIGMDTSHPAWPWRPGTSSWIEPTVHTIIALKKAQKRLQDRRLAGRVARRIHEGELAILVRRCADGGWNHGSASTFHIDAPSYPESTALALLGLQGRRREAGQALDMARIFWKNTRSPLAKAWLSIALQTWGDRLPSPPADAKPSGDIMLAALEALAHPEGNHVLLRTGEPA